MGRPNPAAEARAIAADELAQETARDAAPRVHVMAPGYVRAEHPDTGLEVTFVPGEALPTWAASKLSTAVHDEGSTVWVIP